MGPLSGGAAGGMGCVAMTDEELVELAIEAMDGWSFWRDDDLNVVELTGADGAPFLLCDDPFDL